MLTFAVYNSIIMCRGSNSPRVNVILSHLIHERKTTIVEASKVLGKHRSWVYKLFINPYKMTGEQMLLLSGFFRVDFRAFVLAVYSGKAVKDLKADGTLSELLRSVPESVEEDK